MRRSFDWSYSKQGLGYICLSSLLVLLFYWEGVEAYFNGTDMFAFWQIVVLYAQDWYLCPDVWRPVYCGLTHLAYINFGLNPIPYHLFSLTLYISILPLLYYFYNQLQDNRTLSKVAVLLFASSYLNAEAVATIPHQTELLKGLFCVVALICFSRYRKTHSLRCYTLALLFTALALLSRESSFCLPLILLVVDYHISCGAFPPKLLNLEDLRKHLLPHAPFWLMALALLTFLMTVESPLLTGYAGLNTLSSLLDHVYWLWIYSFSPCFITDRLTIVLALSIMGGLVWLFYRSTPKGKSLIVTMTACTGLSLLPCVLIGPVPRYFLLSSIFSMFLVTLLAFEIGSSVYRLLEERWGYRFYPDHSITFLAILILLPAIYLNYRDVRQYNKNSVYAGRLLKEIIEGTVRILPEGPGESAVIYLNLPNTVQSKAVLSLACFVAFNTLQGVALELYCRRLGIPYYRNARTAYVDLGYDKVKLSPKAWYDLVKLKMPGLSLTLSDKEFDALSMEGGKNKILFFNPGTNKLIDVSGWSYEKLEGSIAPYRDRLNYTSKSIKG